MELPFTLRQLEIFELICDLQSFRKASDILGISQASVSNQIKALETQLGMRLLKRDSGRRPVLTADGADFLADLAPFWKASDRLASHRRGISSHKAEAPARIKVMIGQQLLEDYVRPKLAQFLGSHPEIQLMFDSAAAYFGPRGSLSKEYFDLALFVENVANPLEPGIEEISRVWSGIYGHRSFAEGRAHPLTPEELSQFAFVLPPRGSFHESETLGMLARHNIAPGKISGRTQYFDVLSTKIGADGYVGVSMAPLLRPEQRAATTMLYRLDDWRLAIYRNPQAHQPHTRITEEFLVSSIIDDPAFSPIELL